MASVLHQSLAIPLWMTALCAIALILISGAPVPVTVLLAIALVGSMIKGRWPGIPRGLIGEPRVATANAALSGGTVGASTGGRHGRALPRAADSPAEELNDALDLVRMDDDGGWSAPVESSAHSVRIFTRADGFRKDGTP